MNASTQINSDSDLVIVAHPDDESIFFAGLILSELKNPHIICVTDGNADGLGDRRAQNFAQAMKILGVDNFENLGFPDIFENRLDLIALMDRLRTIESPSRVFTHGPLGEYGHPHHQDVCFAVHKTFNNISPVYGVAHNCEAELKISVEGPNFQKKAQLLSEVYFSETQRFINMVSLSNVECFCRYDFDEVKALYEHFSRKQKIKQEQLKKFSWYWPYLNAGSGLLSNRPF